MTINDPTTAISVLEETVGNGLNSIEFHLKRIADALEAQTPPPQKLYELNVNAPVQETPSEEK